MATTTTNFGLRKPAAGDQANYVTDLNAVFDVIDAWLGEASLFGPLKSGYLGWTQPTEYSNNSFSPTTQLFYVASIPVVTSRTCTGIAAYCTTTPSATGNSHQQFKLFDATGTQVAASTDDTSAPGAIVAGFNKTNWAATFVTSPQIYYALIWMVTTQATKPTFTAATNSVTSPMFQAPVENNSTTIRRWGSFSTGSTTAAPSSITVTNGVVTIAGQTPAGLAQPPCLALY